MQIYKTKVHRFAGTDFHEVRKKAFGLYAEIKQKSKRRTYVRSAYFNKEKFSLICSGNTYLTKKSGRTDLGG